MSMSAPVFSATERVVLEPSSNTGALLGGTVGVAVKMAQMLRSGGLLGSKSVPSATPLSARTPTPYCMSLVRPVIV